MSLTDVFRQTKARLRIPKAFKELFIPARYKAFYGGRGSAKSHSFAAALILMASTFPLRVLCCREFQRSIRESVKAVLDSKIVAAGLQDFFVSTDKRITGINGSTFFFEGLRSNPTAIQSYEDLDIAYVEEAQTVSVKSLDILIPTLRKAGSEIWAGWNPRSPKDPIDVMFRSEEAQREFADLEVPPEYVKWVICRRVNWDMNPYFPSVLRAEMLRDQRRDPDKYAHIWLGEYAKMSESRVFKNWKIGTMEIPEKSRPYWGADWGFSVDPTVLVRVYIFKSIRTIYIDAEVVQVGCRIEDTPKLFDQIDEGMARKYPVRADSARPEMIDYMRRHGYPGIAPARKGPGSLEEGVEFLKSYDIVIHPNCKRTIDEFTLYSYEVDEHTQEVLPELADEDNNVIDAVRYAVEEERRGGAIVVPGVFSAKRTTMGDNQRDA